MSGWTLRRRLLVAVIGLLALICLIVGIVTHAVLRQYLVAQVDGRLQDTASHAVAAANGPGPGNHPPLGALSGTGPGSTEFLGRGDPAGTLYAKIVSGEVTQASYLDDYTPDRTNDAQNAALATIAVGDPVSRNLPGLGDYRLVASNASDGSRIVTGLPLSDVNETLLRLTLTEIFVALAGLICVGLVGETIIRRTLRPLNRVAATATRVSEMQLDRGEVALSERVPDRDTDPRTEVGQVGASLNRMLGHVGTALTARHASETRVRQFVADASHELRTPLAAIRGYAELTRRMDDQLPDDVAYAMRRVESESARMSTLVDDLLLLARLDSGRPIDRAPVDMSRLVVDAVSDAQVSSSDHTWRLELPDEPVTVVGDEARLHQVLVNLLANARAHTPAGTTVIVTLSGGDGEEARLAVADDGPGISADLQPAVFERFARGDTSRSRAAGSTGLGLAIVAAVVEAHGGMVSVESRPGRTAFTVALPVGTVQPMTS
ncbi:MAG TPA: HAMP domain-containing sensor histidine kinase [Micromonosporaceae bacterium]